MKKLLVTLFAFIGLVVLDPSVFAIDGIIHDIANHTIGHGHHQHYYDYNYGYNGYAAYPGYYGYGRPYYTHTHVVFAGSHQRHHSTALTVFGQRRGHRRR